MHPIAAACASHTASWLRAGGHIRCANHGRAATIKPANFHCNCHQPASGQCGAHPPTNSDCFPCSNRRAYSITGPKLQSNPHQFIKRYSCFGCLASANCHSYANRDGITTDRYTSRFRPGLRG